MECEGLAGNILIGPDHIRVTDPGADVIASPAGGGRVAVFQGGMVESDTQGTQIGKLAGAVPAPYF